MSSTPLPVVLASGSPRRIELLKRIVDNFEVLPADLDEDLYLDEDPRKTALDLARAKAAKVYSLRPHALVIGADTVVALNGKQYAKPRNAADAVRMLSELSAAEHEVVTGVCLLGPDNEEQFFVSTRVAFRTLSMAEIEEYVATGEPMDKAGAYAIQGGAEGFVRAVTGSISNVVGFPVEEVSNRLKSF